MKSKVKIKPVNYIENAYLVFIETQNPTQILN